MRTKDTKTEGGASGDRWPRVAVPRMTVQTGLRSWTLVFPGRPPRPNQTERMPIGVAPEIARKIVQARQSERRKWKEHGYLAAYRNDIPHMQRIRISATFYRRALNVADEDGDQSSLKHLVDGLVAAGVIPKDTRRHLVWGDVTEERGRPYRVELVIEELEAI